MKNSLFKFIAQLGLHHALRVFKKGKVTVLSLHRINEESDPFFEPIRPYLFRQLLEYVSKYYTVTTFAGIAHVSSKKPILVLSFDDGYYDFIDYALPLLRKHRLPANHNLVNACLNGDFLIWTHRLNTLFRFLQEQNIKREDIIAEATGVYLQQGDWNTYYLAVLKRAFELPLSSKLKLLDALENHYGVRAEARMMSWKEAKSLSPEEVEIGCHTYNHDSLNQVTDKATLDMEIGASKIELTERLDREVNVIAFPNGQTNPFVNAYCRQQDFRFLLLVNNNISAASELRKKDQGILVSRIGLNQEPFPEMLLRTELFHSKIKNITK